MAVRLSALHTSPALPTEISSGTPFWMAGAEMNLILIYFIYLPSRITNLRHAYMAECVEIPCRGVLRVWSKSSTYFDLRTGWR
jgi:hypothetical protein